MSETAAKYFQAFPYYAKAEKVPSVKPILNQKINDFVGIFLVTVL